MWPDDPEGGLLEAQATLPLAGVIVGVVPAAPLTAVGIAIIGIPVDAAISAVVAAEGTAGNGNLFALRNGLLLFVVDFHKNSPCYFKSTVSGDIEIVPLALWPTKGMIRSPGITRGKKSA